MTRFLLYGHGGSYNRGAQAIVQVTARLLRVYDPQCQILLSSHFPKQDRAFRLPVNRCCAPDALLWKQEKSACDPARRKELAAQMYQEALSLITPDTLCLAIGGDNFCYPNWHRQQVFQERAQAVGAKSILWGCSIEPDAINEAMLSVLSSYSLILARESCTYDALRTLGLHAALLPDPAFLLSPQETSLPDGFLPDRTVGINLSPLVMRRQAYPGALMDSVQALITYIMKHTNMNIAFIPHVTMPADNDDALCRQIDIPLQWRERVCWADGSLSAGQYKWLIAQCALMVCARTHASIAAYSGAVPTLVMGYSVKSHGLARDLGMSPYVLDIAQVMPDTLLKRFIMLHEQAPALRAMLRHTMHHGYIRHASEYAYYLDRVMQSEEQSMV